MLHQRVSLLMAALVVCGGCFGPTVAHLPDESPYILGGKMDAGNIYLSTVMVNTSERRDDTCSGVLIGPRLVLTAGHCVCMESALTAPMGEAQTVIDGSVCTRAVTVTIRTYGKRDPLEGRSGVKVEPHPRLKLFYTEGGVLVSGEADLAAIYLDKEVKGIQAVEVAKDEVKAGNSIIMVGFGFTSIEGEKYGEDRYFGANEISEVTGEIFRVTKQGTHTYHGDSGGPCLRWPKGTKSPVLVGITRGGVAPVYSTFTSTVVSRHREWLEKVIREAKAPSTADSP